MTRPKVREDEPWRSPRAMSLRRNPITAITSRTRWAVWGRTPGSSLTTRETVFRLTRAARATSSIVGRLEGRLCGASGALGERSLDIVVIGRCPYSAQGSLLVNTPLGGYPDFSTADRKSTRLN